MNCKITLFIETTSFLETKNVAISLKKGMYYACIPSFINKKKVNKCGRPY